MSALPEVVTQTSLTTLDSEPVLLALRVEEARQNLVTLLLSHRQVAQLIAQQLLDDMYKGTDFSEIILIKNNEAYKAGLQRFIAECAWPDFTDIMSSGSDEVVQEVNFVQPESINGTKIDKISETAYQLLQNLHFLPVYLLEVSNSLKQELLGNSDLEKFYLKQISRSRAELKELRQEMIACNTGLVAFVARKYKVRSLSFDDLMQEGLVGLIKAVDRFDPDRGNCFSTYAIFWIKQAISRLIVKQDKVVPLPVALAEKSSPVFEKMRQCYLQHERWPSLAELKACCDLSEQDIKVISSYYQSTYVMDMVSEEDDDGMSVMERMQQQQFSQPLDDVIDSDLVTYMDRAMATLPEKQATILSMRFGLKNHTEMTLQAVADQLQVTRERVRQIQNEALGKLKQQFGFDLILFLEPNDT
jgi:RNA polymerase primary sigma factor